MQGKHFIKAVCLPALEVVLRPFSNMKYPSNRKKLFEKTDEELILLFKIKRDPEIISVFYHRYSHLVLGVSLKYLKDYSLAEDITMQVFEKLLNKLHLYDILNFKNWIYSVTKNECMMLLRKKVLTLPFEDITDKKNGSIVDFYEELHQSENADDIKIQNLKKAIENLSDDQKSCVMMFYFENKSYKDIEESTGYSMKQIKSYIQNGKRNIKKSLTRND